MAGGSVALWTWPETDAATITAAAAFAAAEAGTMLLIDIRRPDEWARTGIPQGAVPIDMRRGDFEVAVLAHTGGVADMPLALICARGVRSGRLSNRLATSGFGNVRNVAEGMLGSAEGPGWIALGLPVTQP